MTVWWTVLYKVFISGDCSCKLLNIYNIYMVHFLLYMQVNYSACLVYLLHLIGIIVAGMYMAIGCEINVSGCYFSDMCSIVHHVYIVAHQWDIYDVQCRRLICSLPIHNNSMINKSCIFLFFSEVCTNLGSICKLQQQCSGTYMYSVVGIFLQGNMPVMWRLWIQLPMVTLLIAVVHMRHIYWHNCLISAHALAYICGIWEAYFLVARICLHTDICA